MADAAYRPRSIDYISPKVVYCCQIKDIVSHSAQTGRSLLLLVGGELYQQDGKIQNDGL